MVIKKNLTTAFQILQAVTGRVLQNDDSGWTEANLIIQKELRSIRDELQSAQVATEGALRELSDKSQEARHEEEKVMLLSQKFKKFVKSLENELPIVLRSENIFWKEASETREELTLCNKQISRRKEELENMVSQLPSLDSIL